MKDEAGDKSWIIGGDFNMITFLREKKGARRVLDRYKEDFSDYVGHSPLIDIEMGNGWYTWNNR